MARVHRQAGTIEGIHGTRGEVRFRPLHDEHDPLVEGQGVVLVPPTLEDRRRKRVTRIREDRGTIYLSFSDVRDRAAAELCAGRTVLALADELPPDWGLESADGFVGLAVQDRDHGDLGRVVAVEGAPAQELLVVEGPFGEVLVPAVEPILGDVVDGVLEVTCPPGLVELAEAGEGR